MRRHSRHLGAVLLASCVSVACSAGAVSRAPALSPPSSPAEPTTATVSRPANPIDDLLAAADRHFERGRAELALGHLVRAKAAFNEALELLLESPQGVGSEPRIRDHFTLLVDRIAALELTALAAGDGFTERSAEPASIDQLLALGTFDTTPPSAETIAHVQGDLRRTVHDIPIPLNERVLRYVELFQGRLREFLASGLERGAQYLPMIQSVFRAEGLPLDLAYVPLIESAFKPTALSRAKAKGVWQFMRGTGIENGLTQDWYIDERSDPHKATVAAARYFKTLHGLFDDWHLAMASYNGGPGRLQRAMKRSGRKDFWTLSATSRYLPRETREYVPMILAAVIIAKNPARYGFDVVPPPPPPTETVAVPPAVDLRRIAEWSGVSADEIQALNPELRRWTTPIRGDEYTLRVPHGTADIIRERLALTGPDELNALQWHVVRRGETLAGIARKLRVSRADLAEANYLRTTSRVSPGQKLLIPRMPSAALLARAANPSAAPAVADARPAVFEDSTASESTTIVHRVRAGETLFSIARKYRTTIEALKADNNLRGSILKIGARLTIHGARTLTAQQQ